MRYPNGTVVTYTYDACQRLKEEWVTDAGGSISTTTYDRYGSVVSTTDYNKVKTTYEYDTEGNLVAAYTRVDSLIAQTRTDKTSYYLYDGHGDVRGLADDSAGVTDRYRYNAYGELLERQGTTESHYLRARYMNPETGSFISMDTYEGSIYDPTSLRKYLYANANPVKYTDPSGHFGIGLLTMSYYTVANNYQTLNLIGLISGFANATITSFLGQYEVTSHL